ncbi:Pro-rich N-terminal domain-containing protein [Streptomyces kanasensis]|uniref:Pro-rich N-terminal domain-containing protein n=1 Tax=Streptomyces kanasensis TaxID=936756 RepID=UPI0037017063
MQHAVGAPLPPPHQPGHAAAGWAQQGHHPGPPPPPPARPPAPHAHTPHAPHAQQAPHSQQAPHGHVPQAPPPPQQQPGQAPGGWTSPHPVPHAAPVPPPPDTTGHVRLPAGAPVTAPVPEPGTGPTAGTGTATLAVLLIGPAGAGKTTVARYWAQHRRVPTAHISLDDVREWVCAGFADPQSGWNDQSEAQYRLARRTCGFAARNFLANGISCILDDAVFPDRPVVGLGGWKRHVGPGLLPVVLLPGLEIVLERNAERSGNRRLSDEEVAGIHGRMAGWHASGLPIIDNSHYDVETTARALDDVLARSLASPPSW